jgi:hypothetical protein
LAEVDVSQSTSMPVAAEVEDHMTASSVEPGEEPDDKRLVVGSDEAKRLLAQAKKHNRRNRSKVQTNDHADSIQLSLFDFGAEPGEQSGQLALFAP